ncbi:MAG: substrate-binding domain-containing protein [Chloroflexi bacterium]|nr:substrate-binding domain-containing protein [Chloroflexota bacterium]
MNESSRPLAGPVSRRNLLRTAAIGGTALALGPALAASGLGSKALGQSASGEDHSNEEYVLVGFVVTIDYWKGPKAGLAAAGRDLGVKTTFTGPETFDVTAQVDAINQVVARNPAGLIILPADSLAVQDAIGKAIAAGIPVITTEQGFVPDGKELGYLGFDRAAAGARGARYIAERVTGPGTIAALVDDASAQAMRDGLKGFQDELAVLAPDLKVVVGVDNADPEYGTTVASQLIQANPDLKGFMAIDTSGGPSAARAAKETGRSDLVIVAGGLNEYNSEVWPLIESGEIGAGIVASAFMEQYLAVQYLFNLNRKAIAGLDWRAHPEITVIPRFTDVGNYLVDSSNVATLQAIGG